MIRYSGIQEVWMIDHSPAARGCLEHRTVCAAHEAEIRRLEAELQMRARRSALQQRQYRVLCAERMRRWIQAGRLPQDLLRTMEREKREHLERAQARPAGLLATFLDLGIAEARAESRLLYAPA